MSKLPPEHKFLDLSDYGRQPAVWLAKSLKNTAVTPIQVTGWFIISGIIAILCIYFEYYFSAGLFLILKSILDAADGQLSREKETPSFVGRYYDSIADIILNFFFLAIIAYKADASILYLLVAFVAIQLQGTLYNYYYVILRNKFNGDTTSRIFETEPPIAMPGESQVAVNRFFHTYNFLYIAFDKMIYLLDSPAAENAVLPPWFMTTVSICGLGFQLLIMSIFLSLGWIHAIIPFFAFSIIIIPIFIFIRRIIS